MSRDKSQIEEMLSALRQQKDELALQIHLGNMEAKDEFDKAKTKLDGLTKEFEPLRDAVEESATSVFTSLELVGEELLASFNRVRKSLK